MIMSSIAIPDSIYNWLDDTSKKKSISKNALVIASIMNSMDAEDIDKLLKNMEETLKHKQTNLSPHKKEQELKFITYISKLILFYDEKIKNSILPNSKNQTIDIYTRIITNKLTDIFLENNIEFEKKDLSQLVEKQLRLTYKK